MVTGMLAGQQCCSASRNTLMHWHSCPYACTADTDMSCTPAAFLCLPRLCSCSSPATLLTAHTTRTTQHMQRIASQELGISEAEFEDCLATLCNLLPDLAPRLAKAPPQRLAQLAAATHTLAARLLRLRTIFPKVIAC